jgi:hypothetical protein
MEEFKLKEDHLKLLRNTYAGWDGSEYGAPSIDSKRPFGNSGRKQILSEIAEIIGIPNNKRFEDDDPYFKDEDIAYMDTIYSELETVLQIILLNAGNEVKIWTYVNESRYGKEWVFKE